MKRFVGLIAAGAVAVLAAGAAEAQNVRGVTDTEIVLGTSLDLSGPITFWGVPMRNGHIMRIEEENAKGGVHGRKIRLIVEDNGYDPKKGVLATQKLIQRDKVFAMVGMLGTPVVLASMPLVLEAKTPLLFPGTNHKKMYDPFHKLKFSMAAPYDESIRVGIKYFIERGKKRIAVIYQDDDFGKDIRDAVRDQAKKMGQKVVAETSFKRGATSFTSQVARARRADPHLLVITGIVRETIGMAAEMHKVGWKVDTLVPASACNAAVPKLGKQVVEGLYILCQYVPLDRETASTEVKDWMDRYQKRFGKPAGAPAAIAYDMEEMVILALQRAGRDLTQDKFIAALESIDNWQSIFGAPSQTFGPKQRLGTHAQVLTQIVDGKFKRIAGPLTE